MKTLKSIHVIIYKYLRFSFDSPSYILGCNSPNRAHAFSLLRFPDHTLWDTHPMGLFLTRDHLFAEAATCTTQETNVHDPSGIRTRDPSNQADTDLRLRPHGIMEYCLLSPINVSFHRNFLVDIHEGDKSLQRIFFHFITMQCDNNIY